MSDGTSRTSFRSQREALMPELQRRRGPILGAAVALVSAAALAAQTPSPADQVAALKQSLAQNQAALRTYTWVETTTISLKGEVKKQEQKQCAYGADGKVQKTPMPGAPPAS